MTDPDHARLQALCAQWRALADCYAADAARQQIEALPWVGHYEHSSGHVRVYVFKADVLALLPPQQERD